MSLQNDHFKSQQARLVYFSSDEYKQAEKARREALEKDWKWQEAWEKDEMADHSEQQDYDPWKDDDND